MGAEVVVGTVRRFPAMGSEVSITVYGDDERVVSDAVGLAEQRVLEREARWTRFRADSELSLLNANPDTLVVLPRDTFLLVRRAIDAWHETAGRFDPTVLDALEAAGYGPDGLPAGSTRIGGGAGGPAPGCGPIVVDDELSAVVLPKGVRLDLGGIGKGWTADLVLTELLAAGATAAAVDMGGDIALGGDVPGGCWEVTIEAPSGGGIVTWFELPGGAVATSTDARRRWADGHHLIDAATGRPRVGGTAQVTVVAETATVAEVWAKAAFVTDDPLRALADRGLDGIVVDRDGTTRRTPGFACLESEGAAR